MAGSNINGDSESPQRSKGALVYRHSRWTRLTHWTWAIALVFLLMSGLQIFNAHPGLYIGQQSGFEFDNSVLIIGSAEKPDGSVAGSTTVLGVSFDTTGLLGVSGPADNRSERAFPDWATLPSYQDLATGRVVHFFFGWFFAGAFLLWFVTSLVNGHLWRDIVPRWGDIQGVPRSLFDHLLLRFHHDGRYNGLQKLSYAGVLLVLFPLIIFTGLTMSPGMNAAWPWLLDIFGGRQTARTIHFVAMVLLVAFFVIHIVMVLAAGPLNEMRSIITGWYRKDPEPGREA